MKTNRVCRASRLLAIPASALALCAASDLPRPAAVVFEGGYSAEVLSVTTGGLKRGTAYRGLFEAALQADLAGGFGVPRGARFRLSALMPQGGDFSGTCLGDLQGVSNIEAYNHPLLYELWLAGQCAEGRFDWRVGRLVADSDFATTRSGGVFRNSSFGWPAFISANTRNTGPAFARTALGVFASLQLADSVRVQAGLYDGDSFDDAFGDPSRHPNGLHLELGHGQGAFAIGEVVFETNAVSTTAGRPGVFKLGAWRHTADFADQFDSVRLHSGNGGVYFVAEQMLWRETGSGAAQAQGLTGFARAGCAPDDRSRFGQTADAGLSYSGLFPGRDFDVFGIGVAWARLSGDARRSERAAGLAVISDYELVVETSYEIVVRESWRIVPDLQWVRHPGGSGALRNALVVGLRTRLTF